ncbi:MAG: hypothetical protein AB8G22_22205 [Saprospiraceae bacterium]
MIPLVAKSSNRVGRHSVTLPLKMGASLRAAETIDVLFATKGHGALRRLRLENMY